MFWRARVVAISSSARLADFAFGDEPTYPIATENIQDVVQIVVSPLGWPQQFGDIPAPQLVGLGRQQLGLDVSGVTELIATLTHLLVLIQNAVHRPHGAQILAFIDQGRIDFPRRLVLKTLAVENLPNDRLLRRAERSQ